MSHSYIKGLRGDGWNRWYLCCWLLRYLPEQGDPICCLGFCYIFLWWGLLTHCLLFLAWLLGRRCDVRCGEICAVLGDIVHPSVWSWCLLNVMGTDGQRYFESVSFLSLFCVVVGNLWGCKVGKVVWKYPTSEIMLEEVCVLEEVVSAPLEMLLHVIVIAVGYYPHI